MFKVIRPTEIYQMTLNQGQPCFTGDIWKCLETFFLVVTTGEKVASGI